jgi:acetyltransferase
MWRAPSEVLPRLDEVSADTIRRLSATLAELLRDAVEDAASVGFVLPLSDAELTGYIAEVADEVNEGRRAVVLAFDESRVVGMVQLAMATKANSRHRAAVQKLIVHTTVRRQGLGRRLMTEIERLALEHGRSLLLLDTQRESPAEALYRSSGYTEVGVVPRHAALPDGQLAATTFFFKELTFA